MKMIEDAIRGFLWGIVQLVLIVSDWVYDMINKFMSIDISSSNVIWFIYGFGILFITIACTIRIFFLIIQKMSSDEDVFDMGIIGKRIFQMFVIIALVPTIFTFSLGLPATINDIFTSSISIGEKMTPSTSILTSIAKTPLTGDIDEMTVNDEIITVETVGEKIAEQQDGKYIYFTGYGEIFFCGIMGILIAISLINVFTQIVSRWFIQIFRLFIGFVPLSSMVDPKDSSCNQWIRDIISDVLIQSWTLIALWAVLAIMGLDAIASANGIIRLFMFWIGIASITKLGNMIAKYMQATDLSTPNRIGSAFASVGLFALGKAGIGLAKSGASFVGNSALTAGAGSIQNIGQKLGAKNMTELGVSPLSASERFSKIQNLKKYKGYDSADDPLNITPYQNTKGQNINSMSGDTADSNTVIGNDPLQYDAGPTSNNEQSFSEGKIQKQLREMQRVSRPDTFARTFSEVAENTNGIRGKMMRTASNVGSHLYMASAMRYSNSTLRKAQNIISKPKTIDIPNNEFHAVTRYKQTLNKAANKNEFDGLNTINNLQESRDE